MRHTLNDGQDLTASCCKRNSYHMLPVTDWLCNMPENTTENDLVEVQFKNTRKGYFCNSEKFPLEKGQIVTVEAQQGHDVGEVTLTGRLVKLQMEKNHIDTNRYEIRKVYRLATEQDLERAQQAHEKEHATMIRARELAKSLELKMKIGDVEYQGDGSKAIFYYIADERVDFRQLIKVYAETFRIRIEMKQIGARQEAGRIGGTGPCGRELCCSTWMTNFCSVGTTAARVQGLSLNPQKLAGQCAKLKCCLNYEMETYQDALEKLPPKNIQLETLEGTYYFFSCDALKGEITYSTDSHAPINLLTITGERAREIMEMNKSGKKPDSLGGKQTSIEAVEIGYENVVGQDDVTRFDKKNKNNRHTSHDRRDRRGNQAKK